MGKSKVSFELDKDQLNAIAIANPNYKEELDELVNKQVDVLYKKYIDPKVREFLQKMKKTTDSKA